MLVTLRGQRDYGFFLWVELHTPCSYLLATRVSNPLYAGYIPFRVINIIRPLRGSFAPFGYVKGVCTNALLPSGAPVFNFGFRFL